MFKATQAMADIIAGAAPPGIVGECMECDKALPAPLRFCLGILSQEQYRTWDSPALRFPNITWASASL